MTHLSFGIHGSAFGPGQKTYDLQLLHFTFQVNAPPVSFLPLCQSSPRRLGHCIIRILYHPRGLGHPCHVPKRMSKNQKRNCPSLWENDLLPLTAPSPVSSLLAPFHLPILPTCANVLRASMLLLSSAPPALSTPGRYASENLQERLFAYSPCPPSE